MSSFDIASLIDFSPPVGRCPRCLAIFTTDTWQAGAASRYECPVCRLGFLPGLSTTNYGGWPTMTLDGLYSKASPFLRISLPEPSLDHAKTLAALAVQLRGPDYETKPIRLLLHLLLSARSFIHIMSTGLSQEMLGVLRTVGELSSVAAIFSNVERNTATALEELRQDGVPLDVFVAGTKPTSEDLPHTKLIIVDGLVAIAGSVNFTTGAWRKAADRKEHIDVITDAQRVIRMNNNYFAHHWNQSNVEFKATGSGGWRYDTSACGTA